jgi:acetyltransferase-like isoleucine patch superfamily enzyme
MADLPEHVRCGPETVVEAAEIRCGRDVSLGRNVHIRAERLLLGDGVTVEDGVRIDARHFQMDAGARLESGCRVSALGGPARFIHIGEHSLLGDSSRVLVPVLIVGDYVAIQNHALVNGLAPVLIGHNSWFGQNCILNSNASLTIGNHVGIGPYSSVYTHGFFGDLLEGCQVHKEAPVVIEDDAWIVGSYNVISPGVTIGRKAMVLTGSTVTRDVPANHCVGGMPARDLSAQFTPFRDRSAEEKVALMATFLREYVEQRGRAYREVEDGFLVDAPEPFRLMIVRTVADFAGLPPERPLLVFTAEGPLDQAPPGVTLFHLMRRTYTRQRSAAEIALIRWLKNPRARFVPADRPTITLPSEALE